MQCYHRICLGHSFVVCKDGDSIGHPCLRYAWGKGWRKTFGKTGLTPLQEVNFVMMSFQTTGLRHAQKVCKLAAKVVCPDKDISTINLPNKDQLQRMMVKLDLLHCLVQRHFHTSSGILKIVWLPLIRLRDILDRHVWIFFGKDLTMLLKKVFHWKS